MIVLQTVAVLLCFVEALLRFIGLKYKSEKIFKLSGLVN